MDPSVRAGWLKGAPGSGSPSGFQGPWGDGESEGSVLRSSCHAFFETRIR
jgi:hypothetical protein